MPGAVRVVDRIIDQADFDLLGSLSVGDVIRYSGSKWRNFAGYGAALPTSPVIGQVFVHTPTGRANLVVYDGSAWYPILSIGTWTVYVDTTNGTDNQNLGFGTGTDAFKTIGFAAQQISRYTGNITINVASGTYAETVNIRGKIAINAATITIRGEMSVVASITATGGVQGSTSTFGSVEYGSWGSWENKWLQGKSGSNNNVYRIIDSISGTTATVVGYWAATPTSGDSFDVVEPATIVNQINCSDGQMGVNIENIQFNYNDSGSFSNVPSGVNANVSWFRCRQSFSSGSNISFQLNSGWTVEECFFERCRMFIGNDATLTIRGCKFFRPHTTGSGGRILHVFLGSKAVMVSRPSVLDGASNGCTAWLVASGGRGELNSLYSRIRNCTGGGTGRGIRAETTSSVTGSANVVFASNDTNTSADASTYGVIA